MPSGEVSSTLESVLSVGSSTWIGSTLGDVCPSETRASNVHAGQKMFLVCRSEFGELAVLELLDASPELRRRLLRLLPQLRHLVLKAREKVGIQHTACAQLVAESGENYRLASQLLNLMATNLVTVDLVPAS